MPLGSNGVSQIISQSVIIVCSILKFLRGSLNMANSKDSIDVKRVEAAFNPVQDQDLDIYGEELKKYTIVDVDVHVDDTLQNMLPYMDGHFGKRLEAVLAADFMGEPHNSLRNMIAHVSWLGAAYDKHPRAKLATKEDLLERMEYGIIDYSILFPSELLPIGYLPDPKWAAALASAISDALDGHLFNSAPTTTDMIIDHLAGNDYSTKSLKTNTF